MPRKGENIYKRKDGRWEGRYIRSYDSEHKAKYAYVYGKTYSEVKRKLTEQRGNVQKVQPTKNKSSTYGELLDCWLHSMQLNTKSLSEVLGHANVNITLNRYVHSSFELKHSNMNKLASQYKPSNM